MLNDVLNTFCIVTGYQPTIPSPIDGSTIPNPAALDYINRASKDLYNGLESDSLMREIVLIVQSGLQITLPTFIGEARALRQHDWFNTIPINEIGVPRFTSDTWKYRWNNWTYKGKMALANYLQNTGPLTFVTPVVANPPVSINIVGTTGASNRLTETLLLTNTSTNTVNSFSDIETISSFSTRAYDIVINDIDGNYLATLYNNEPKTIYNLFDVSKYSWMAPNGDGVNLLVDVLYKVKYKKFVTLADEFMQDGFDDAIAYKALSLWCQGKEDKQQDAILYMQLAKQVLDSNVTNDERGQVLKISHAPNRTYQVFKRFRTMWGWKRSQ